jgi:predicted acyl esterase
VPRYRPDLLAHVRRADDWIPLADGTRLSVRLWRPTGEERVPVVLEYLPYRKGDATSLRDETMHPYLAAHGYACARVDIRGTGESEGFLADEYTPQEQADALEVIEWLAAQPWSSGRVAMYGKSWGGFNGLQVAAHAPPALGAVISVFSTDDRYETDIHYLGGSHWANAHVTWGATMLAFDARPPDPDIVGPGWREQWLDRLERTTPFMHEWLRHQRRDDYWRQGSICEDWDAIRCPILAVGGWADPYPAVPLRMAAAMPDRVRALIGPWGHVFPHEGLPGPAIGWLQECVRFLDHHLKGLDNGEPQEPRIRLWMQDPVPPRTTYAERPGRWVAEERWPSPRVEQRRLALGDGSLGGEPPAAELRLAPSLGHGLDAPFWLCMGAEGEQAPDQRAEDGRCLVFETAPLTERVEVAGVVELEVVVVPERPVQQLVARLCDVASDGASTFVTVGALNLTHRAGHAEPQPLEPGAPASVTVPLKATAYAFPPGHRIRLAVAGSWWPWLWPAPEACDLVLRVGGADGGSLLLPVRPPSAGDAELRPFPEAEATPVPDVEQLEPPLVRRETRIDPIAGTVEQETANNFFGRLRLPGGTEYADHGVDRLTIDLADPATARVLAERTMELGRNGWSTRVETTSAMWSDRESFHLQDRLEVYEGDARVFARDWTLSVPRDLA